MGWTDTIRSFVTGHRDAGEANAALRALYVDFRQRADTVDETAALAPTAATAEDLRRLAADHRSTSDLLAEALQQRAVSVPTDIPSAEAPAGRSHWARVVDNLERCRSARNQVFEVSAQYADTNPDLVPVFDALTHHLEEHVTRLRGEIARADPQAVN